MSSILSKASRDSERLSSHVILNQGSQENAVPYLLRSFWKITSVGSARV